MPPESGYANPYNCGAFAQETESIKFVSDRPFAAPDAAANMPLELTNAVEPVQDGRIYIKKIGYPFSELWHPLRNRKPGLISCANAAINCLTSGAPNPVTRS